MKFKRCYDIALDGRPSSRVQVPPEPRVLHLPLWSRRFSFSRLCVEDGQRVKPGRVLAEDPANYSVPLLAPREGTVRLDRVENHVTLEDIARVPEEAYHPDEDALHAPKDMGSVGMKRYKLVGLGAWQFFQEAHGGALPDPFGTPSAVMVSTLSLEPFLARGNVHIGKRLESFTRGLEQIQSLLEYQPIYLVLPDIESALAERVRQMVRGYASVTVVPVPLSYPCDNVGVLARKLGLKHSDPSPVWAVGAGGVLAVDRALTLSLPSTVRLITVGGPGAEDPRHVKAMAGYPLDALLGDRAASDQWRVLNGGALTGERLGAGQVGLDAECEGLTILAEHVGREFIGFMLPGWSKRSYSNCFLSLLRGVFRQKQDTALNGEPRACISCQFCEEVCPGGLMPHLIHKCLYRDDLEEAERAGIDLCVGCGLCTYVCPSKIELRMQLLEGAKKVRSELHPEEVSS